MPKKSEFSGKMIEVEIFEAGKHFLKGRPVEDSRPFTPSITEPLEKGAVSGLTQVRRSFYRSASALMVLMVQTGHSTKLSAPAARSPSFLNAHRGRNFSGKN